MSELIVRGGTILTMNDDWHVATGDVASRDGELVQVGGAYTPATGDYQIVDASGCVVMPGLVQSHVHMCQTLARGRADGLALLDWLRTVVWPYESVLTEADLAAAARLACAELLLGGTTAVLDMGTVHHTDALFAVAREAGIRATIGKAMMDIDDAAIPRGLREETHASLRESEKLCQRWHGSEGDRLRYAYCPRFALSCTDALLREVAGAARQAGALIHTHASENADEIAEVERQRGKRNIAYLHEVGLTGADVGLAHCVWLDAEERRILAETGTHLLHCPSSNLKLGSGVAEVPELIAHGVSVSLGADGAPCNNNLDGFLELRLAALVHSPRCGPAALPASRALALATRGGARALGLEDRIGSLEVGKRADLAVVAVDTPHAAPTVDPYSAIVYAARSSDVRHVAVEGRLLVSGGALLHLDAADIVHESVQRARQVFARL
jgi:5-methylthioadenosine/S-adenosylhomocysteine deaminase